MGSFVFQRSTNFRIFLSRSAFSVTSVMSDSMTPWILALQIPLSMKFSREVYWSGYTSPGHLPDPGINPGSPTLQADSLLSEPPGKSRSKDRMQ